MLIAYASTLFFLLGSAILIGVELSLKRFSLEKIEEKFSKWKSHFFIFRWMHKISPSSNLMNPWDAFYSFMHINVILYLLNYAIVGTSWIYLDASHFLIKNWREYSIMQSFFCSFILSLVILLPSLLCLYFFFYTAAIHASIATLKIFSVPASLYMLLLLPITYPIIWLKQKLLLSPKEIYPIISRKDLQSRLLTFLNQLEKEEVFNLAEKKLFLSLAKFGGLVAREIMVPRSDVVCLSEDTPIKQALLIFKKEGFSRIPLFRNSVDHITSVALYKDVMMKFYSQLTKSNSPSTETQWLEEFNQTKISDVATDILYTPETRKIWDLFQEMCMKKMHAVIVVNEYGSTEGLITIEDIIEELIGREIHDEHDESQKSLCQKTQEEKTWIVDASMSILDAEKEMNISFPHRPEYETIAGFVSMQTDSIPKPGTIIHGNQYDIHVLKSNERQIFEVKIRVKTLKDSIHS